jgi:D-alanyl-lipoteichoic acid acyltransferase DltB (MBOAT superfamily)
MSSVAFWAVTGMASVLAVFTRSLAARRTLLAAVNVSFLVLLLGWRSIDLFGAIVVTWLTLLAVARPRLRLLFTALAAAALVGLFLVHKLPAVADALSVTGLAYVLGVIGYSYVALRVVEVVRAVFEGRHEPPDLISTINYLLPFHMLAAGPIQSYDDFVEHRDDRFEPAAKDVFVASERIASGLFKKFVLAHLLQTFFLTDLKTGGVYFLLEMQVTFIWLFLDFSAYSDVASGIGVLIGVATPENFNRPLLARNVIDFWERWHISLSQFIRRNIFIPLQTFLMRRNDARTPLLSACLAIGVSFVLCGLWHGLGVGFLVWGGIQAGGLIAARVYGHVLEKRLGRAGVKTYLRSPWAHAVGVLMTFELQAAALVALIKA